MYLCSLSIHLFYFCCNWYADQLFLYGKNRVRKQKTLPKLRLANRTTLKTDHAAHEPHPHTLTLKICQKTVPPNHPTLANSYNNIGNVHDIMSEYVKALSFYKKALEIKQKTLSPNHPSLATSYNNIGDVYNSMGEYSKALSFYECVLDILQRSLPANHPHILAVRKKVKHVKMKL
jgi:tetratricopeptide (TPR) repeat protein